MLQIKFLIFHKTNSSVGETMKRLLFLFISIISFAIYSQSAHRIMSYNLLNYPGHDTTTRNPYFRTIVKNTAPDILIVQEITSLEGVSGFLNDVMNSALSGYSAGDFIDGPDSDSEIYFKSELFTFINTKAIQTALRNIYAFTIVNNLSRDTLIIYSVHLKASSGATNAALRGAAVDSLRKVTDRLPANSSYIVVGDYNFYSSSEIAYQKLIDQSQPGYFIDPLNMPGTWHDVSAYAKYFTQSSRLRQFGGGASGGLDDRFDLLLISPEMTSSGKIALVPGSYTAYGNDGSHMNDSINSVPNTAVSQNIANALHYASDHLPVFASFEFSKPLPVELTTFTAMLDDEEGIKIHWITATELNNYGFTLSRKIDNSNWQQLKFFKGAGSKSSSTVYNFIDRKTIPGNYQYRLNQIDNDGSYKYYYSNSLAIKSDLNYSLSQNYPNPFNPVTRINFSIPHNSNVKIEIYNGAGQLINTLLNHVLNAGNHSINWDASKYSSGIYFYKIETGNYAKTKKCILLK